MIRSIFVASAFALSLSPILAQETAAPAETPAGPMAAIQALAVDKLATQLPNTRLGRLLADEEVAEAIDMASTRMRAELRRRRAIRTTAASLDLEIEPWLMANMYTQPDIWRLIEHPLEQVQSAEMLLSMQLDENNDGPIFPRPDIAIVMACRPRYQGRWHQAFERDANDLRQAKWFVEQKDAKIDGFPAYIFTPPKQEENDNPFGLQPVGIWQQRLPGRFAYGVGLPAAGAKVPDPTPSETGEVSMLMDLKQYMSMFAAMGRGGMQGGVPSEFATLGFDKLNKFIWRGRFEGELVLDEAVLELSDAQPTGIIGALLLGKQAPPAQALPKGAILQLRVATDIKKLTECFGELQNELPLPPTVLAQISTALDGGISLGVCAPAPGGMIPRIYLSLGIADEAALRKMIAEFLPESVPTKKAKFSGVDCTMIRIPDAPQGIQPAFCIVDGTLHVAESGRSLRTFLKAQKTGAIAMDVGDAPLPQGPGNRLETLDLRFDEVELYRAYLKTWLPLYELSMSPNTMLSRDEMPSIDVIEEHCGKSRGALFRNGNRFHLRHLGPLGGPEAVALAMTWGPILSEDLTDYMTQQLSQQIARHKLEKINEHFDSFEEREQRRPKDLAELIVAENLARDLLLMPEDDLAEDITLPDGKLVKSSFRYFPEGVEVDLFNGNSNVVMIEIRPQRYGRGFLCKDGTTPESYGEDCSKPIDKFGK